MVGKDEAERAARANIDNEDAKLWWEGHTDQKLPGQANRPTDDDGEPMTAAQIEIEDAKLNLEKQRKQRAELEFWAKKRDKGETGSFDKPIVIRTPLLSLKEVLKIIDDFEGVSKLVGQSVCHSPCLYKAL